MDFETGVRDRRSRRAEKNASRENVRLSVSRDRGCSPRRRVITGVSWSPSIRFAGPTDVRFPHVRDYGVRKGRPSSSRRTAVTRDSHRQWRIVWLFGRAGVSAKMTTFRAVVLTVNAVLLCSLAAINVYRECVARAPPSRTCPFTNNVPGPFLRLQSSTATRASPTSKSTSTEATYSSRYCIRPTCSTRIAYGRPRASAVHS